MRWKLGKYQFNAQTNVLLGPAGEKLLEPKASALLRYFLENAGRDISRDELIQSVWDGQIVTDGAINRVVVQLRRELGDDAKIKHMIVTVPKVGYRFVFQAIELDNERDAGKPGNPFGSKLLLFSAVLILSALAAWSWLERDQIQPNANISPMVRLATTQTDAAHAAKTGHLVYVQQTSLGSVLYLAAQADAPAITVGHTEGTVDAPTWSSDNDLLAYRYRNDKSCHFRLIQFDNGVPTQDDAIYACEPSSTVSLAFNKEASHLYFTERETPYAPFHAFELDLKTGSSRRLSQPVAKDRGNHHLDMHLGTGHLLLLHNRRPGKTSAFLLNPEDNSFERLIDWPYEVDYAIWGHDPGTIVHPGEHPSYRLLETQTRDGRAHTLISDSRRIKEPARIENGRDYLFTSYIYNQDIFLGGLDPSSINSSVMDYLATISRDAKELAFISKRTGTSLIWLRNLETDTLRSIDADTGGQKLRTMDWSYDSKRLLLSASSGLIVVDSSDNMLERTIDLEYTAHGASWTGENEISYSINKEGRWYLYRRNLANDQVIEEDSRWAFLLKNQAREIHIDQRYRIFENGVEVLAGHCAKPLRLQDLTLRLDGNNLYCISKENPAHLIRYSMSGTIERVDSNLSGTRHYSVANGRIARTDIANIVSDIMRTNYQGP